MSPRKEVVESKEDMDKPETPSSETVKVTTREYSQDQQAAVNRALEETKDSIRRSIDEARSQIPRYTQSVNEYQEQTIQAAREMADNYIESQKEIINSFQSAWVPYAESMYERFYEYCMSPRRMTEAYTRMVSSFADNMNTAIRAANNIVFTNMDAFKTLIQRARDNAKELSRIGVNAARLLEQKHRGILPEPPDLRPNDDNS